MDGNPDAGLAWESTRNRCGFMHEASIITQAFVDFAPDAPGLAVDIGAAYGVATLPALEAGARVLACDRDATHLQTLRARTPSPLRQRLDTVRAVFPEGPWLAHGTVGAVLLSHVLHFLDGPAIERGLRKVFDWLAPGGKVFVLAYTPYYALFESFIPEYERRLAAGWRWPGQLDDIAPYCAPSPIAEHLPDALNLLDVAPLGRALRTSGFHVRSIGYLGGKAHPVPEPLRWDGREWVGAVAIKRTAV